MQAFTTDTPPRIAVDIPDTSNGLDKRRIVIGSGATSAVSAVEAGGRTRVVVDLFRPAGYTTRSAGNLLVLTVDAGAAGLAGGAMANPADPTKRVDSGIEVANVDFRRGENGAGRVILRFDDPGATADLRNEGSRVVVDVANATIPENLRRRLDVTDFATPVKSVDAVSNAGTTRLVIDTNGAYESMAYQTGNEYVIEIAPKRGAVIASAAPMAAGQVPSELDDAVYSGRPVTFNFQDVPVRTVLQLIAEESNLNIVASGTLIRRNVTLPCTVSDATMLRFDSSAISCSTVRTGTSWKLKVTGRPVYTAASSSDGTWPAAVDIAGAITAPRLGAISITYSLPVWYAIDS